MFYLDWGKLAENNWQNIMLGQVISCPRKVQERTFIRGPWRRWFFSTVKDQDVSWVTFSLPLSLSWLIFSIWTWKKAESVFFKCAVEPKLKIIILDDKIRLQKGLGSQEWWVNIYRIRWRRAKKKACSHDKCLLPTSEWGWLSLTSVQF